MVVDDFTALLEGPEFRWNGMLSVGAPVILTYSFADRNLREGEGGSVISPLQTAFRSRIQDALDSASEAAGLVFLEVREGGMLNFMGASGTDTSFAFLPFTTPDFGGEITDIVMATDPGILEFNPGGIMFEITLHEIGHALGLKHPFEGAVTLSDRLDNTNVTLMSYTQAGRNKTEFQELDLDALTHLYGPAFDPADRGWRIAVDELTGTAVLAGGDLADTMIGVLGQSTILGGAGGDTLVGRGFDDRLSGQTGDDLLILTDGGRAAGGAGSDIIAANGFAEAVGLGGAGDDRIEASAFTHQVMGNGDGQDTVVLASGFDQFLRAHVHGFGLGLVAWGIEGGAVVLRFVDGEAVRIVAAPGTDAATGLSNVAVSLSRAALPDLGSDALALETLNAADTLSRQAFGAAADRLVDGAGASFITLGGGADSLDAGGGDDIVAGGTGADTLGGGTGHDLVSYSGSAVAVTVDLDRQTASGGDATGDRLSGFEGVIGTDLADRLTLGDAGGTAHAGGGADRVAGGLGADALALGTGDDVARADVGADTVQGGAGNDFIQGWRGADLLRGGDGADTLFGDFDDDVIEGGRGDDRLIGGTGRDRFVFDIGFGADRLLDFTASDRLDFRGHDGVAGLDDLTLSAVGSSVLIRDDAGGRLVLADVALSSLDAGDFLFA